MKKLPASKRPDLPKHRAASRPAKLPGKNVARVVRQLPQRRQAGKFDEVLLLIVAALQRAYQAINTELVGLYWELGGYLSRKIASAERGDGVVDELPATIAREYPGQRGFTRRNLFRMRQFFETYRGGKKVSPRVTQLSWTHHLIILSQIKHHKEREFHLIAAIQ